MRIYIHSPGIETIEIIEDVDANFRLSDHITLGEGDFIFVDEQGVPIDCSIVIAEIEISPHNSHHHVHRHPCREISTEVSYNGRQVTITVRPNSRVGQVLDDAIARFEIDPVSGADLVLRLPGSNDDLSNSRFIGGLVSRGSCALELNLLAGHREHG